MSQSNRSDNGGLIFVIALLGILIVGYLVYAFVIPEIELWWHNTVVSFEAFIGSFFHLAALVLIVAVIVMVSVLIFRSTSKSR